MRKVYVTAGTRAAGKSTFCQKALDLDPSLIEISRDKILIELFGDTSLDPYTGGHDYANDKMWEAVEKALIPEDIRLILDVWNGDTVARRRILRNLHAFGADQVIAWYFVTPLEFVAEWFWQKPGITHDCYGENAPRHDHKLFHKLAVNIDSDGFDGVVRINPVTMNPEEVLRW